MKNHLRTLRKSSRKLVEEGFLFLSSPIFIKNMGGIVLVLAALLFLTFSWMDRYTNHLKSREVENFIGMPLEEAIQAAKKQKLSIAVNDSIFKVGAAPHLVLEQSPSPHSRVKKNRTVYLVITKKLPDLLLLPDLKGGNDDYARYRKKVERLEFKTHIREEVFNEQLAPNTILNVYLDGEEITEKLNQGFRAVPGATLEFVVTKRLTNLAPIPNLVCKKFDAARFLIFSYNLTLGAVYENEGIFEPENAYVYKQEPAFMPDSTLLTGSPISLYLSETMPVGCPTVEAGESDGE